MGWEKAAFIPISVIVFRRVLLPGGDRRYGAVIRHGVVGRALPPRFDHVQAYPLHAPLVVAEGQRRAIGEVDDPAGDDRSAVVDLYYHGSPLSQGRDPHGSSHG